MKVEVTHNKKKQVFQVPVDNNKTAYLRYRHNGINLIEYYETFVPREYRGNNIATQLTEVALSYAKKHNMKVIPSCPFVASIMDKNKTFEGTRKGIYNITK